MKRSTIHGVLGLVGLAVAALGGCHAERETSPLTDRTVLAAAQPPQSAANGPEVSRWLAGLRQATTQFKEIPVEGKAPWNARITGCLELPGTGAMGFHYADQGLIDGTLQEFSPELLVYEPQKNGRLRLVAVEYIVPYTTVSRDGPAPVLHGVALHHNDDFGLWVLHAWVWKNNPAGIFSDWNPTVSCQFAGS